MQDNRLLAKVVQRGMSHAGIVVGLRLVCRRGLGRAKTIMPVFLH